MTAKLTNKINLLLAQSLVNQIKDTTNEDSYYAAAAFIKDSDYIVFSGSDSDNSEFESLNPKDSIYNERDNSFYAQNTTTLHRILPGGVSRVVPRIDWARGRIYEAWSPTATNYYVLVREFVSGIARLNVYKCLYSPKTASLSPPAGNETVPFKTFDNYWWKYMYTISNSEAIRFLTEKWMPVPERVTSAEADTLTKGTTRYVQNTQQSNTQRGTVFNAVVDSDLIAAQFTIDSDNIPIAVRAKSSIGSETLQLTGILKNVNNKILFDLTQYGVGYEGRVIFTTQDGTVIKGLSGNIAPGLGHASDAPSELNASNIMLTVRNVPDPDGDFIRLTQNSFQMINLIRNPIDRVTNNSAAKDFYFACKSLQIDSDTSELTVDDIIHSKNTPSITARVVGVSKGRVFYIHNKENTESNNFTIGDSIVAKLKEYKITHIYNRQNIFASGDLLVSDWMPTAINRSSDQIESMNFIIQL